MAVGDPSVSPANPMDEVTRESTAPPAPPAPLSSLRTEGGTAPFLGSQPLQYHNPLLRRLGRAAPRDHRGPGPPPQASDIVLAVAAATVYRQRTGGASQAVAQGSHAARGVSGDIAVGPFPPVEEAAVSQDNPLLRALQSGSAAVVSGANPSPLLALPNAVSQDNPLLRVLQGSPLPSVPPPRLASPAHCGAVGAVGVTDPSTHSQPLAAAGHEPSGGGDCGGSAASRAARIAEMARVGRGQGDAIDSLGGDVVRQANPMHGAVMASLGGAGMSGLAGPAAAQGPLMVWRTGMPPAPPRPPLERRGSAIARAIGFGGSAALSFFKRKPKN
jgi:hypothetical protein